jgi:endonuclease YncB( thermonuclease family)
MPRYFVLAFLLLTLLSINVEASTLFGRVIEVNDGDVLTVFNLNRPVRIKLVGVDAPEAAQAFGEVARKHLSDLVYDKSVLVEYWGISADSSLVGRVLLGETDIGAQMIRDGAAWFDASNQGNLSVGDREMYQQSQQAARNERRGLWQASEPVAPWEFVRAQALKRNPAASLNSVFPAAKAKPNRPTPELTNLTLIASRLASSSSPSGPTSSANDSDSSWAASSAPKNWQPYKPSGESFSALVPDDGMKKVLPVAFGDQMVDINVYAARDGWAIYALMWITGPSYGEADRVAIQSTVQGFLRGFADGYQRRNNSEFACEMQGERRFSAGGFSATEYDLPSCTIPAKVRAYTRVVGGDRQMYVGAVFYSQEEDANVARFMRSFNVTTAGSKSGRSATRANR